MRHDTTPAGMIGREQLIAWLSDARERTLALAADLSDEQLMGPMLPIVNPGLWEIAHVAWFQEKWLERGLRGKEPMFRQADSLYDSAAVPHDARWDLPLFPRARAIEWLHELRGRTVRWLGEREPDREARYFTLLCIFHEDMHAEALLYTRQTLGYPAPAFLAEPTSRAPAASGDASIPAGSYRLGAEPDLPFAFDNEKWAHPRPVARFAIATAPVTQGEFARFVEAGGYREPALWSEAGWRWRERAGAEQPVYWRRAPEGGWQRRAFDRWRPLEADRPMLHACWFEAEAYCRFAGRRLPSELEWEVAAAAEPDGQSLSARKRLFPWGDEFPWDEEAPGQDARADLGMRATGPCPAGDARGLSAFGCADLVGGVWEWTADDFAPYPGFVRDPYQEYSEPWFFTHKVLRGGCFATAPRLIRNSWRNFYSADRRDVWAGFRTCAIEAP